jgi:hypothetical protein
MAAIDVKTGVYLPPYSLQTPTVLARTLPSLDGEAALQKPVRCPFGYVGHSLNEGLC